MKWLGYATAFCALVGSLWGGKLVLDTTYAGAAATRQELNTLKLFILKGDLRALQKERFELEVASRKRPLTDIEMGRLNEINEEIRLLEQEMRGYR